MTLFASSLHSIIAFPVDSEELVYSRKVLPEGFDQVLSFAGEVFGHEWLVVELRRRLARDALPSHSGVRSAQRVHPLNIALPLSQC